MSTFPLQCPDSGTPDMTQVYRDIQANTTDLNSVMRAIITHTNDMLNDNQLDINACEHKVRRHIGSEIGCNKRELTRLADQLMEVILHGTADIAVAGDAVTRHVDSAVSDDLQQREPEGQGTAEYSPAARSAGENPAGDGDRAERAQDEAPLSMRQVPTQQNAGAVQSASANVVRIVGPDGEVVGQIIINITVLPAPINIIREQGGTVEIPAPAASPLEGLSGPRGGAEDGFPLGLPVSLPPDDVLTDVSYPTSDNQDV